MVKLTGSLGHVTVKSYETHLLPPARSCDNTSEALTPGKFIRALLAKVLTWGLVTGGPSALRVPKFQTSRMSPGFSANHFAVTDS